MPVSHVGFSAPVKIGDDAVIVIVLVGASASVIPIVKTIPVGVLPANKGSVPLSVAEIHESELRHVGATSDDQLTDPALLATLHVRVVAALIMNPLKQWYVATIGLLALYSNEVDEYVM